MRCIGRGVTYDGSLDPQSLAHTASFYYGMDSLYPLTTDIPTANQLATSFGTLAEVARDTLASHKRKYNTHTRSQMHEFIGDVLLDRATIDLRVGRRDLGEISTDVNDALEIFSQSPVMKKRNSRGKGDKYDHHSIGALFGTLSARAMNTYIEAKRSSNPQAQVLGRAVLSGIYADTVTHMGVLSEMQAGKTADEVSNVRGRFMEMTAFAHNVLNWTEARSLTSSYVRFAVNREDCPRSQAIPRRGFDLLRYEAKDGKHVPVQVKVASAGVYHSAIRIWRPTRPQEIMADTSVIVDNFSAIAKPDADVLDLRNARSYIAAQFEEKDSVQK